MGESFSGLDVSSSKCEGILFDECTFVNCNFAESILNHCSFTECVFTNCNLSSVVIGFSLFNDVRVEDSKAIGVNWALADKPFLVNFYNSNISMSSFQELNLRNNEILNCKAHDVDFSGTNLEKANFADTDLLHAQFNTTNLKHTDFSQAINYSFNPSGNILKSTKVSFPEATALLKCFDLEIV